MFMMTFYFSRVTDLTYAKSAPGGIQAKTSNFTFTFCETISGCKSNRVLKLTKKGVLTTEQIVEFWFLPFKFLLKFDRPNCRKWNFREIENILPDAPKCLEHQRRAPYWNCSTPCLKCWILYSASRQYPSQKTAPPLLTGVVQYNFLFV